ncbi:hypothetical protein EWB00_004712 [Schistosoma japonicum]|uniref:Uncharacterized protein n=1 Tax=Schistosoma japonicum TaxID=6182 RepID=A0A4Z2D4C0_SCHJA|nr:hypothetical protein EWB00_004712 [Schistosoma japonicum]
MNSYRCIYQNIHFMEIRYMDRLMPMISKIVEEHDSTWLRGGNSSRIRISIIVHHLTTVHTINSYSYFKVIYMIDINLPKSVNLHLLCTAEAILIHKAKPELSAQKKPPHRLDLQST